MLAFAPGMSRQEKINTLAGGNDFYSREGGMLSSLNDEFLDALGPICLDRTNEFDPEVLQELLITWSDSAMLVRRLKQCADSDSRVTWATIVKVTRDVEQETALQCMVSPDLVDKRLEAALK